MQRFMIDLPRITRFELDKLTDPEYVKYQAKTYQIWRRKNVLRLMKELE